MVAGLDSNVSRLSGTPLLLVDPAVLDANLEAMQTRCDAAGVALRPHVKGHKCAWIAARQVAAGRDRPGGRDARGGGRAARRRASAATCC
jgi:hypothetical protein